MPGEASVEATPLVAQTFPKPLGAPPALTPPVGRARFGLQAFLDDAKDVQGGTLPVSMAIAFSIGIICGVAAYVYYEILEFFLDVVWESIPEFLAEKTSLFSTGMRWVWIPIVCLPMSVLVGLSIKIFGEPGDLISTVGNVHKFGFIDTTHVVPMLLASQFSIIGGGSLGPEAPLVAICGSIAGFVSRYVFKQKYKNVVRKHTLNGMACALAAFFGVPLGGSLFALEVNSRLGYEYYEHALESVLSGTTCLFVFRGLTGLPIGHIWTVGSARLDDSTPGLVALGTGIGALGAFVAFLFAQFHAWVVQQYKDFGIFHRPVPRAIVGGVLIATIGVLVPHTMFWGEFEFATISTLSPAKTLEHVWPTTGLTGFEITSASSAFIVGVAKMVAISATVSAGYRGGFIFPFFAAGAAFGRALQFIFPAIPVQLAVLCFAAGINVAITRTALATTVILCALSGEINAGPPVLAAALVSLFSTAYMPFIKTQQSREDSNEAQLFTFSEDTVRAAQAPAHETENDTVPTDVPEIPTTSAALLAALTSATPESGDTAGYEAIPSVSAERKEGEAQEAIVTDGPESLEAGNTIPPGSSAV